MRIVSWAVRAVPVLLILAAGCHDSTAPRPQSALVGLWDVTTTLTSFQFETGAPSPPDCPGYTMYCTHTRLTTDGAYLAGVLEVRDTTQATSPSKTLLVSGMFELSFCDSVDYVGLTGCTHVSDRTSIEYSGTIAGASDPTVTDTLELFIGESGKDALLSRAMRSYAATFSGDSISGPIYWGPGGRSPPTYRGIFVAHRRK